MKQKDTKGQPDAAAGDTIILNPGGSETVTATLAMSTANVKVVCPVAQLSVWEGIVGSEYVPESNNNEINVVKKLNLDVVPVIQWTNTDTNYAFTTDCEDGLRFKWRRKPKSGTWTENDHEVAKHKISARWTRGWTNPRGLYFVGA